MLNKCKKPIVRGKIRVGSASAKLYHQDIPPSVKPSTGAGGVSRKGAGKAAILLNANETVTNKGICTQGSTNVFKG
ncbi:hypothetical protein HK104_001537 [Borealophlyctis nickersoniae]|nr:hypothetical protein HK104_001537 [Borealophlyctis nickersoniae]